MAVDTGHGGTLTFGTTGLSFPWRKIGAIEQKGESVEDTDLDDLYFKSFLPGDVVEPGEFEVEYAWDARDALAKPALGVVETITITLPLAPGGATAADLEGTGFIMARTAFPEMATNGLQIGKMKVAFNGVSGVPTWTKAT